MGRYVRVILSLALLVVVYDQLGGFVPRGPEAPAPAPSEPVQPAPETEPSPTTADPEQAALSTPPVDPPVGFAEEVVIGRGESFYVALQRVGLSHETIMGIVNTSKSHTNLRKVKRGDTFELTRNTDHSFQSIRFDLDAEHYLDVVAVGDEMQATLSSYPLERVVRGVRGVIESSLFEALLEQNADPILAGSLADILGWDIDFFRDLRKGDTFVMLSEEFLHEGRKVRDGQILAARFVNRGQTHDAYLFENEFDLPSYFDEAGNSLEKQFLRAPLKYSRISSGFSKRRLHPITKRYRPHYGVDYSAPTGTPVLATADGSVITRTRKSAEGNFVGLRHGQGYESYYLHLSKFPRGLKVGDKVRQGDVIGFVGNTGWSTAPHLDYRIKKNGRWIDPRKLKLPPAKPVPEARRAEYEQIRDAFQVQLAAIPTDSPSIVLQRTDSRIAED